MAKDPAFLFYSKDWLEGTMELSPDEKGIYIDLLAHQHQKGNLPNETKRLCKLVGLSESEFLPIWNGIKQKFKPAENDRIHNLKLTGVVTERLEVGRKNKIIGIFGTVIRTCKKPQDLKDRAKKGFKVDDFMNIPTEQLTDKITEWFTERLTVLGNEDGNGDAIANILILIHESIKEEKDDPKIFVMLVIRMMEIFKTHFPKYPVTKEMDYSACLQIAYRIAELKQWKKYDVVNGKLEDCLSSWKNIVKFIEKDDWLSTRSLSDISGKEWQRLVQKMSKNKKQEEPKSTSPTLTTLQNGD